MTMLALDCSDAAVGGTASAASNAVRGDRDIARGHALLIESGSRASGSRGAGATETAMPWTPHPDDLLFIVEGVDDIVWLRDGDPFFPRRAVAQIRSSYDVGPEPYIVPLSREIVQVVCVTTDETALPLLYIIPVLPEAWPFGYSTWLLRWLAGW